MNYFAQVQINPDLSSLTDSTTFTTNVSNQAMPQVTAFASAVIGVIFVVALIKAVSRG